MKVWITNCRKTLGVLAFLAGIAAGPISVLATSGNPGPRALRTGSCAGRCHVPSPPGSRVPEGDTRFRIVFLWSTQSPSDARRLAALPGNQGPCLTYGRGEILPDRSGQATSSAMALRWAVPAKDPEKGAPSLIQFCGDSVLVGTRTVALGVATPVSRWER
ncbi:MAG: hypothetical protein JST79_09385 [Acidobacteria bacterium]|nr:hypothetical protein [Acidobacteriota bacterium]